MNSHATANISPYGEMIEATTLKIQRVLPGPVERVWDYLTRSELRRQWLAAGHMDTTPGASFELVWRNNELTNPPGKRPEGFGDEHRMQGQILDYDPPRKLAFTWQGGGDVTFTLEPRGERTLLTVVHRGLVERSTRTKVGPGWHSHLDILAARMAGTEPEPFWDHWARLQKEYEQRV
jgi:uncharacterized protein YndB with AHSA1/START domain